MPHIAFVALSGLRVRDAALAEVGATLPGLAARADAVAELPSLGLLTLAGLLPEDWSCSYHESSAPGEALLNTLLAEQPALVALSALTPSVAQAYQFADMLRRENIPTALGGLHATACPDEAARHVDAVVAGEGELTFLQVLGDVAAQRLQKHYSAVRTLRPLPWAIPRFDLAAGRTRPRWTVQTQRGCPLSCEFCAASRTLSRFREKPAEQVRVELAELARLSPHPVLELADDNTFAGPRDPAPLLATLAEVNARYFTEVDWRIGERPDLLARMAASGCVQVLVGIESLVFRFPGMGAKESSLNRVMAAIQCIQSFGIAVNGCFIVGADGETRSSIDRMRDFIVASPLADVQATLVTPFPGTPLRARFQHAGRLLPDRDWSHHTLFDVTFQPDRMRVDDLERGFRDLLLCLYDRAQHRRRAAIRRDVWRRHPVLKGQSP